MDLTQSIEPKSDQLDAVDLSASGPRVFTVEAVSAGSAEQPVNIHLAEFPRVWRPSKSMRRVLVAAWGADGSKYAGRRVELYCDPEVAFGGIKVGGIRVSRVSHIEKPLAVSLLVKRGKSEVFTVKPLPDEAPAPTPTITPADIAACADLDQLRKWHGQVGDELKATITARAAEIKAGESND